MGGKGKWKKGFLPRRGLDADSAIKWGGGDGTVNRKKRSARTGHKREIGAG